MNEPAKWDMPLEIQDINHLNLDSIQEYFEWYFRDSINLICKSCNKSNMTIHVQVPKTPRVIIIDFLGLNKN